MVAATEARPKEPSREEIDPHGAALVVLIGGLAFVGMTASAKDCKEGLEPGG
jgi:hypothetical protein